MISRAQAEALLKLAEALEECERNGLTLEGSQSGFTLLHGLTDDQLLTELNGMSFRLAIAQLYPKSEDAEC